jgi:general secretion pathway protein B
MSILLEALKKSERQRQLGETPTLQTSIDDQAQSQVSLNHWIPLSLMALSACVMVWFGWQQFRVPELGDAPTVPAAMAKTDVEPQPRTMTESFLAEGKSQEEQAVPPPAGSKKSEDEKARLNQSFNDFTADNDEAEAAPPTSNQIVATELSSTQEAEPEPLETRPRQPGQLNAEPGQSSLEPGLSSLKPHIAEPISYWELPQGVRDNLPEIKITVLVYADKPDDRFLLTNGQRMAEKDELQSGLVLDEIRRDGAIFLYRNYRFLVKG